MYKNIIVPIDMGQEERGRKALKMAEQLRDKDGTLHLVTVIEEVPAYVAAELPTDIYENSRKQVKDKLLELAKGSKAETQIEIRHGRPASEILNAADECNADLIIVASHRPELADYLLGSTAARVVRHANCAVLVDR